MKNALVALSGAGGGGWCWGSMVSYGIITDHCQSTLLLPRLTSSMAEWRYLIKCVIFPPEIAIHSLPKLRSIINYKLTRVMMFSQFNPMDVAGNYGEIQSFYEIRLSSPLPLFWIGCNAIPCHL